MSDRRTISPNQPPGPDAADQSDPVPLLQDIMRPERWVTYGGSHEVRSVLNTGHGNVDAVETVPQGLQHLKSVIEMARV